MSENFFTDLYNKIVGLFGQSTSKEDSKDVAVNRLRVVLMQDRTNLTPELLQRMRRELVELLSKYVEMDKEALELNFEQEGEQMALMLSIPVVRAKDEKEIEAALKADDEKKAEESNPESIEEKDSDDDAEEEEDDDEFAIISEAEDLQEETFDDTSENEQLENKKEDDDVEITEPDDVDISEPQQNKKETSTKQNKKETNN